MSSFADQLDPIQLMALLTQQRDLYQRLRELSNKQRSMISGDRPEMLLNILRDRQDLVTSLAKLNDELAPFRRSWDEMYASLPEDQRKQASGLLQEINGLLRVILSTDQEDGALLTARKQTAAGNLAGISGGKAANTAYGKQTGSTGSEAADVTG